MKKVVFLAVLLMAISLVPSAFAVAELKLISGASSVDILDEGAGDACSGFTGCVTFLGTVGSWNINVTTGMEGSTPILDLNSVDTIFSGGETAPLEILFSDDGMALPPGLELKVG